MIGIDDAKSISLIVGGKRVDACYYEAGSADRGSVIFVQTGGAGTTAYMCWHMNIEAFADAGFRVYAPDAPGFGKSKLASADTGSVDGEGFLLAFMDAVGVSQAHLVGNSMGAMTAARFAASNPGRVRSVTLSGGEPRLDTDETKAIAPTLGATPRMNFVREMLSKPQLAADDMRRATADFFYDRDHPAVEGAARLRLDALRDPELFEQVKEQALGQIRGGRTNYDASLLAQIQAPTFLLHGRDEKWFYTEDTAPALIEAAVKVAFVVPNCRATLLPHCGHWPQLEQPETFNALVIEFLKQHS